MQTYQLFIHLKKDIEIAVGKFGKCKFEKGNYIYTGSAKKNIDSRIARHKSKDKKLHWHIDYFLNNENTQITKVKKFQTEECILNQKTKGRVVIKGFGSSDCKSKCGSHLKLLIK